MPFTIHHSPFTLLSPFTMSLEAAANGQRPMANVMENANCKMPNEAGGRL